MKKTAFLLFFAGLAHGESISSWDGVFKNLGSLGTSGVISDSQLEKTKNFLENFFSTHPLFPKQMSEWVEVIREDLMTRKLSCQAVSSESIPAQMIRKFWRHRVGNEKIQKIILKKFRRYLGPEDHMERISMLSDMCALPKIFALVKDLNISEKDPVAIIARILLRDPDSSAENDFQRLPRKVQDIPFMTLAYFRFLIRKDRNDEAFGWWKERIQPQNSPFFRKFCIRFAYSLWEEARRFRQEGNAKTSAILYNRTMEVLEKSCCWDAEQQYLCGLVTLDGWQDLDAAMGFFEKVINNKDSEEKLLPQCHYWMGYCLEQKSLGDKNSTHHLSALKHYKVAAKHLFSLHGHLAAEKIGSSHGVPLKSCNDFSGQFSSWFLREAADIGDRLSLAYKKGRIHFGFFNTFINSFLNALKKEEDYAAFLNKIKNWLPRMLNFFAKKVRVQSGFAFTELFPVLRLPGMECFPKDYFMKKSFDSALVHSNMLQESSFDPYSETFFVRSNKPLSAKGLMQLTDEAAWSEAKALGWKITPQALKKAVWNPWVNLQLGISETERKLRKCGFSYPMSMAAYNAGLDRVLRWIKALPKVQGVVPQTLLWIESIPYEETRVHVLIVLRSYFIYTALLKKPLPKLENFFYLSPHMGDGE